MNKLKLVEISNHIWSFIYPDEFHKYTVDFDEAVKCLYTDPENAKKILKDLIRLFPFHIDAYHHLALISEFNNKFTEAFNLYEKAVIIGLNCFPNRKYFVYGRDRIEWSDVDNRPFLRALHAISLSYWKSFNTEKAVLLWERILKLNPNDNQGIRDLFAIGCLELERYEEVIKLKRLYKDCIDLDLNFSLALIYYIKGNLRKSKFYLNSIYKYHKNEINSLLNKNIKQPEFIGHFIDADIVPNEEYSNYEFKFWHYKYWIRIDGALNYLEKYIREYKD